MNIEELKKILQSWIDDGFNEGELLVRPEWYVLWRPEEIEKFNRDYQLSEYAPGLVTFGGDGGGELLVVNKEGEVYCLPAISMAPDTAVKIASSLQELKGYMRQ